MRLHKALFFFFALFFFGIFTPSNLSAHQQPTTIVLLDVNPDRVRMELQIPLGELATAFGHDVAQHPGALTGELNRQFKDYLISHIHPTTRTGEAWSVNVADIKIEKSEQTESGAYQEITAHLDLLPPAGVSARQFVLNYDVIVHKIATHRALVSIRNDWESGNIGGEPVEAGVIMADTTTRNAFPLEINLEKGGIWSGFTGMLRLGMEHIKEGTDHLLFLLVLLLPAPLLYANKRWANFGGTRYSIARLLRIVTAFTVGHSLTLLIGALGWLRLPQQPVEVLIAVSILVSAVHAARPIFAGKEMYVAAAFGLVHGLAFAMVLSDLNLGAGAMAISILGFNVGIELMQLAVIALIVPWLILLSRTRFYTAVRIMGASFAAIASVAWIAERVSGSSNAVGDFIQRISHYSLFGILLLAVFAALAFGLQNLRPVSTGSRTGKFSMKRKIFIATLCLSVLLSAGWILIQTAEQQTRTTPTTPASKLPVQPAKSGDATGKSVAAAKAFLAALDDAGRTKATLPFNSELKSRWSNFPVSFVPRNGVRLGDLNAAQREAAMNLLSTALSKQGFQKVKEIMEGDEVLKTTDGGGGPPNGGPPQGNRPPNGPPNGGPPNGGPPNGGPPNGGPPNSPQGGNNNGRPNGRFPGGGGPGGANFGRDNYYLALFGEPSLTQPWMIQFGGHHLAINMTIIGKGNILTPTLTAAQPATYTLNGETIRPLGRENDKGFELINSLDAEQQKQAILNYQVGDLVLGAGEDGKTIQPEGIKVSALNAAQQKMLLDIANEWVGILNDEAAKLKMDEIKANLPQTWFAWSGPTTKGSPSYFRIQGPTLLIEYSPQRQRGNGLDVNHIHTIYRDPTNDYGERLVK